MNTAPIGMFDSGLGGLSVWQKVRELLPKESLIYFADSANCPYGPRTREEIIHLCESIVEVLLDRSCKLILVACNTATASAIQHLRQRYPVPFVGMEPAIKPAVQQTRSRKIGVLATEGTFRGKHFLDTRKRFAEGIDVYVQVGEGLVEIVEKGKMDSDEARQLLQQYVLPMLEQGVDQIVLGCTHYPFLRRMIEEIVGEGVAVIDPAPAVARQVKTQLEARDLLSPSEAHPVYECLTTGNPDGLQHMIQRILPESEASRIELRQVS
ncbi:MAG: glutamate racemase [Bacteroidota bacterium]